MKYLKTTTTYFVDPHGTPDEGGIDKEIVEGEYYDKIYQESLLEENKEMVYNENDSWIDMEDMYPSEDGYNSEYSLIELKPISDKEATKANLIIKQYNEL